MANADRWCRCASPLPPKTTPFGPVWKCSVCDGDRRYYEKIVVQNGGVVDRCGNCRWHAKKAGKPERDVPLTTCRFVTCTTQLAGQHRDRETYSLCDRCTDQEISQQDTADVVDGRQPAVGVPAPEPVEVHSP